MNVLAAAHTGDAREVVDARESTKLNLRRSVQLTVCKQYSSHKLEFCYSTLKFV